MDPRDDEPLHPKESSGDSAPFDFELNLPPVTARAGGPDFVVPPLAGEVKYAAPAAVRQRPSRLKEWEARGGILGTLATLLIFVVKVAAPLIKAAPFLPKLLITGGSMLLTIWAQASVFGLSAAVALAILMLIHETGHAVAAWRYGIPISAMVFIPFAGALVLRKRTGRSVVEDAFIGIMGPFFGALSGVACFGAYLLTGHPFWLFCASVAMLLNLFNLLPTLPFDGGWIVPVFSPKLLAAGVVVLLFVAPSNPFIWVLFALSLPRIIAHWTSRPDDPYFRVTPDQRWRYGLAYLGLVGFLAWSNIAFHRMAPARPMGTIDIAGERGQNPTGPSRPTTTR